MSIARRWSPTPRRLADLLDDPERNVTVASKDETGAARKCKELRLSLATPEEMKGFGFMVKSRRLTRKGFQSS